MYHLADLVPLVDDAGRLFLTHARTLHGAALLGITTDGDDLTTPLVRLVSTLSRSVRLRQYGIACLPAATDDSGARGPEGHAIPTEDCIARIVRCYGDDADCITVSLDPYTRQARQGQAGMVRAINAAGQELARLLTAGAYRLADTAHAPHP